MDDREQIESIKEALDIVSVVQTYVPDLKRSGRNYFGRCPFHKEKTPSFSVNPELKLFKCFGCSEGGDVIKFLQKIEGLDFPKALQLAADKAGIVLKKNFTPQDDQKAQLKKRILEANLLTARFYNFLLMKHKLGEPGRIYAKKRKLQDKELDKFLIGYAPSGFENLKRFLVKKGFKLQELVEWGLLVYRNGRIYDKFRNRLMFTIFDHQGDVVGFSGRLIDPEALGPKYLNSPETPVYHKSKVLYGLYQGKDSIRKEGKAILVEGNVDILSSHGAGIENIVAPLGTALTKEQVALLKRYCDSILFSLDTDNAGQKALEKDLVLLEEMNMKGYILELGEYKDADELIVKGGDWKKTVENPQEIVPYFITSLAKNYDLTKSFSRAEYVRRILQYIARTSDKLLQVDYLQRLQEAAGIDMNILKNELSSILKSNAGKGEDIEIVTPNKPQEKHLLSKYLLALISEHKRFRSKIKEEVTDEYWVSEEYKKVYKAIWEPNLTKNFDLDLQELYEDISMMPVSVFEEEEKFLRDLHQVLQRIKKEKIIEELEKLRYSKQEGSLQRLKELSKELSKLNLVQ